MSSSEHAAPPDPAPSRRGPLAGIRVLDLATVIAGPGAAFATMADYGADVGQVVDVNLLDSVAARVMGPLPGAHDPPRWDDTVH